MTRLRFFLLLILVLGTPSLASSQDFARTGLEQDLASQAIAAIPADLKIATVGIGAIDGDGDGRVTHALTGALARLNRFKVIERRDLDKLLDEQGVQARDVTDPKERVKFGKVKGVQGLFWGQLEYTDGWFQEALTLRLKLASVERGEVVMAKELSASRWHWGPVTAIVLVVLLVLAVVISVGARKHTVTQKIELAQKDERERTVNVNELSKAIDELGRAQSTLVRTGRPTDAARVKRLEVDLRTLKDEIALAPTGNHDGTGTNQMKRALAFDQSYRSLVEAVTQGASTLCDQTASDPSRFEQEIQRITSHIRTAEASFKDRQI